MHYRKSVAHHIKYIKCRGTKPHAWDGIVQSLENVTTGPQKVKLELKASYIVRSFKSTTEILRIGHPDKTFFLADQLGHIIFFHPYVNGSWMAQYSLQLLLSPTIALNSSHLTCLPCTLCLLVWCTPSPLPPHLLGGACPLSSLAIAPAWPYLGVTCLASSIFYRCYTLADCSAQGRPWASSTFWTRFSKRARWPWQGGGKLALPS